jgi:uncharacterized Zn-binding protein involved in type VI secretion
MITGMHFLLAACAFASVPFSASSPDINPDVDVSPYQAFVENRGQWDARGKFLYQGKDMNLWVTEEGAVFDFHRDSVTAGIGSLTGEAELDTVTKRSSQAVWMSVVGARPGAVSEGRGKLPTHYNYYMDGAATELVPLYAEARIRNILPGVGSRFYTVNGQPRYDLVLEPGVKPASVKLRFEGAANLRVDSSGALAFDTVAGTVRNQDLFVYQTKNGEVVPVSSRFTIDAYNRVGFELGAVDPTLPVVIDPQVITASTKFGTTSAAASDDRIQSVAVDPANGEYVFAGITQSTAALGFPRHVGTYQDANAGGTYDYFIAKMRRDMKGTGAGNNISGTDLRFCTFWGTSGNEGGGVTGGSSIRGCKVAVSGAIYFGGYATSVSGLVPTAFTSAQSHKKNPTGIDVIVGKFKLDLGTITNATYYGGAGQENFQDMKLYKGRPVIVGQTASTDLPTAGRDRDTTRSGTSDGFLAYMDSDLNRLPEMATYLGASGDGTNNTTNAYAVDVASDGEFYVSGRTEANNFVTTYGFTNSTLTNPARTTYQHVKLSAGGGTDSWVARITQRGRVRYCSYVSANADDAMYDIAVNPIDGSVVCAIEAVGSTTLKESVPAGRIDNVFAGSFEGLVVIMAGDLRTRSEVTWFGGSGTDRLRNVEVTNTGRVVIAGNTTSRVSWPTKPDTTSLLDTHISANGGNMTGTQEAFVGRLGSTFRNSNGNQVVTFGGSQLEQVNDLVLAGPFAEAVVAGYTQSGNGGINDFPTSPNAYYVNSTSGTNINGFLTRLAASADPTGLFFGDSSFQGGLDSKGEAKYTWGVIELNAPAPTVKTVTVTSSNPAVAKPESPTFFIQGGDRRQSFKIYGYPVATNTNVTISASNSGTTVTGTLQILASERVFLYFGANPFRGGAGKYVWGSVELNAPATTPETVTLATSNSAVAKPQFTSVVIPVGQRSKSFKIYCPAVASNTNVTISATNQSFTKNAVLTVTP